MGGKVNVTYNVLFDSYLSFERLHLGIISIFSAVLIYSTDHPPKLGLLSTFHSKKQQNLFQVISVLH